MMTNFASSSVEAPFRSSFGARCGSRSWTSVSTLAASSSPCASASTCSVTASDTRQRIASSSCASFPTLLPRLLLSRRDKCSRSSGRCLRIGLFEMSISRSLSNIRRSCCTIRNCVAVDTLAMRAATNELASTKLFAVWEESAMTTPRRTKAGVLLTSATVSGSATIDLSSGLKKSAIYGEKSKSSPNCSMSPQSLVMAITLRFDALSLPMAAPALA
mmetsp:Transcript_933/g.3908  ORF Transcript_933/g.3908 Transcript_933/m.3908 type:complete len:217 (-) Transcript_933:3911-4561(-)